MKRRLIALLTVALCAGAQGQAQLKGAATALELNPHGVGHMLVVPYFSTQGGNATLLNLINGSDTDKAVKVRFRGAGNGDELFSLQVFLSRRDSWAVNISAGVDGVPVLSTADRSCSLPALINGQKFSTARLNPALTGDALANQAREGYIEIVAMGDVAADAPLRTVMSPATGAPSCTPAVFSALARFDSQLTPPSTGLTANWVIINVPQTTTWAGEAVAYEARLNGAASTGHVVYFPQSNSALTGADVGNYTSDPLYNFAIGGPIVVPSSASLPDLSTPYTAAAASPQDQATDLSLQIAAREILVEYMTSPEIQASTDWVLTMPTKRYHVAIDYRGPTVVSNLRTFGDSNVVFFTPGLLVDSGSGRACLRSLASALTAAFDREGRRAGVIVPDLTLVSICGVAAVLSVGGDVGAASPTLQASVTRAAANVILPQADGSASLRVLSLDATPAGLPVLVRQFSRAVNPQAAPGVSGTYGATWAGRMSIPGLLPQ